MTPISPTAFVLRASAIGHAARAQAESEKGGATGVVWGHNASVSWSSLPSSAALLVLGVFAFTGASSCTVAAQDSSGGRDAGGAGNTARDGSSLSDQAAGDETTDAWSSPPTALDGGVDAEAAAPGDAGPAAAGTGEICSSEWPQSDWLAVYRTMLATDAMGNSYVALNYGDNRPLDDDASAPPQLNLGTPSSRVGTGFAVAKFDDGCHLLWVREFGTSAPNSYGAEALVIATDSASNVTILGSFTGSVDFGAGTLTVPGGSTTLNGVLLRLDSTGATVFSRQFATTGSGTQTTLFDLAVTPSGVSTVALQTDSDTDFGSGPDSASLLVGAMWNNYVVQFDGTGKVLFRETVPSINSSVASIYDLATNESGFLWTMGVEASLFAPSVVAPQSVTMGVTASGAFAWQEADAAAPVSAAGPGGAVGLEVGGSSMTLQAFASDGTSPWTTSTPIAGSALGEGLTVDATGDPVVVGDFRGTVTFGSTPALTSAGGQDVDVQVFDPTGHLLSASAWGTPDDDEPGGIGVDPAGNLLVAGSSSQSGVGATSRVFFVKLAR